MRTGIYLFFLIFYSNYGWSGDFIPLTRDEIRIGAFDRGRAACARTWIAGERAKKRGFPEKIILKKNSREEKNSWSKRLAIISGQSCKWDFEFEYLSSARPPAVILSGRDYTQDEIKFFNIANIECKGMQVIKLHCLDGEKSIVRFMKKNEDAESAGFIYQSLRKLKRKQSKKELELRQEEKRKALKEWGRK